MYNYKKLKGGNLIEELIKQKGLFKTAEKIGVTPQRLRNWITRKSYPTLYIKPLALALNLTVEELLEMIEKEKGVTHA